MGHDQHRRRDGLIHRLHAVIQGRVQGVGFRYATRSEARALGLSGWVRNLPDGRVEAEFEGERPALDMMLAWCHDGPAFARVNHVEASWEECVSRYEGFLIR